MRDWMRRTIADGVYKPGDTVGSGTFGTAIILR